jgi:transcriptional regulator GlxA family with amidase domain
MQIAIALYPGVAALDFVGPYTVLTQLPGADVVLCAAERGVLADDSGLLRVDVEHTFDDVPAPSLLLVPGGMVTRRMARDGGAIVEWIAAAHATTTYTTSVCTGALLLGAAGVLSGLEATTHWGAYDELARYGAHPVARRVVVAGKVWTAAGVSAGIDLGLALAAAIAGDDVAQAIQLGIEYDPQPPFDAGSVDKAPRHLVEMVSARMAAAERRVLAG